MIEYLYVSTNLYNHFINRLIILIVFFLKSFNDMWILKNRRKNQKFKGNIRLNSKNYCSIYIRISQDKGGKDGTVAK